MGDDPNVSEDSETLSQMLQSTKSCQSTFMYPNKNKLSPPAKFTETPNRDQVSRNETSSLLINLATPSLSRIHRSGTKSLGMRRRFRSVENSSSISPGLSLKRSTNQTVATTITPAKRRKPDCNYGSPVLNRTECESPLNIIATSNRPNTTPGQVRRFPRTGLNNKHPKGLSFVSPCLKKVESSLPPLNENNPPFIGFHTAGNKSIPISKKALKNAEKLFSRLNAELEQDTEQKKNDFNGAKMSSESEQVNIMCNLPINDDKEQVVGENNDCEDKVVNRSTCDLQNMNINTEMLASKDISGLDTIKSTLEMNEDLCDQFVNKTDNNKNMDYKVIVHESSEPGASSRPNSDSPDDDLLQGFESSENHSEKVSKCPSPILKMKRSSRKKQSKIKQQKCNVSTNNNNIVINAPCMNENPSAVTDCSLLSDAIELEMLAIDLTERFDEVCEDAVDVDKLKEDVAVDIDTTCQDACHKLEENPELEMGTFSVKHKLHVPLKNAMRASQPTTSSRNPDPQNCLPYSDSFEANMYPGPIKIGKYSDVRDENSSLKREDDSSLLNSSHCKDDDMSLDDELLIKVGDVLEKEWKENEDQKLDANHCEEKSQVSHTQQGFVTASQKPIKISDIALNRAEKWLKTLDEEDGPSLNTNSEGNVTAISNLPVSKSLRLEYKSKDVSNVTSQKKDTDNTKSDIIVTSSEGSVNFVNVINEASNFVGFKTASNKPVFISDNALARANEFFKDERKKSQAYHEEVCNGTTPQNGSESLVSDTGIDILTQCSDKLTNLFKTGHSSVGKKKNGEFKAPRGEGTKSNSRYRSKDTNESNRIADNGKSNIENTCSVPTGNGTSEHSSKLTNKKILGARHYSESQIVVSDESLIKAAELFEDFFTS